MDTDSKTILVIEDHPDTLRLFKRMLELLGYHVLTSNRALEGLDIARKTQPDLILTDIRLPQMSGRELATTLRADPRFASVPIVAMTVHPEEGQGALNFAAGINGFIAKTLSPPELQERLEYYLGGGVDRPPDTAGIMQAREQYLQQLVVGLEEKVRQLQESNESLRRIDQVKDKFIHLVAHEMRTPMGLILGYVELLNDHKTMQRVKDLDDDVAMLASELQNATGRMNNIVEDILLISRIMSNQVHLQLSGFNPVDLIREVLERFQPALEARNLQVSFAESRFPDHIVADYRMLKLTFINLIGNAIKYTPDSRRIHITAAYSKHFVRIMVRDSGVGIDPEDHEKIFQRFHTGGDINLHSTSKTNFEGGGPGLGLAICRGVIEAHQGKISVESAGYDREKLPGTTFTITLPLTQPEGVNDDDEETQQMPASDQTAPQSSRFDSISTGNSGTG